MAEPKTIPELIEEISGREPETEHKLTYESYAESLEPIYYFVLDLMNDFRLNPEKLVDNFSPSPGSSQFQEMTAKATSMQQQVSHIMGNINVVLKSVLNIIYDLKDFKIRLKSYEDLRSKNIERSKAARLSLKQLWMDKVDALKGNSGIKALALTQGGFTTLIDAFLAADTVEDATHKLDLNDIVKRVVIPRIQEFNQWITESEKALRTRYELERNYLRTQVDNLKLYSRWAKPYLLTAQELEKTMSKNAALVKSFNRTILELTLLGKSAVKPEEVLPKHLKKKKMPREYYSCILIDFVFNAAPLQGGKFIGKVDVTFKGYALNEDELKKFHQELKKNDESEALRLIEGMTEDSLKELQEDIDFFLKEKEREEEAAEAAQDSSNPFLALLGIYSKKPKKKEEKKQEEEEKEITKIVRDNFLEKEILRTKAAEDAAETAFTLFDIYKKAHGMPSYT